MSGALPVLVSSALILGVLAIVPAGAADTAKPGAVKIASVVSMTVQPDTNGVLVSGQLVVLSGTVTSGVKSGLLPTGSVHVLINGLTSKDGPTATVDSAGRFTLPDFSLPVLLNLTEPVYPIAVSVAYDGDDIFAASVGSATNMSAFASNTITTLTSNESPAPYGKDATFHVQVSSVAGLGQPSGSVTFGADGIAGGGVVPLDPKGGADWTTSMTLGKHLVTATYLSASGEFRSSQAQLTQIVLQPTSKVQAQLTVVPVPLKSSRVGFRFSGELQPPVGLPDKEACTGTVKIILAQGRNKITSAASVGGDCRYDVSISFPASAKIQPELEVNATATFSGNPVLQASPDPIAMPLYGGRSPSLHSKLPTSSACQNWHLGCRVTPWVVVLGDSYMAGEGGRWAGNTNLPSIPPLPILTDALGANAYSDNLTNNINFPGPNGAPVVGTNEIIPGCHRSRVDEAFIGGPKGLDLACSGAQTGSFSTTWTGPVLAKPGIDFASWDGNKGQALLLSDFASVPSRKVNMVVLGIGGNDYGFGDILAKCASDYLTSENRTTQSWHWQWYYNSWHDFGWTHVDDAPVDHRTYCSDDPTLTDRFTPAHVATIEGKVTIAINNAARALASQGYGRNDYTIMVQMAPLPVANSASMRYGQGATFSWLQPSTWLDKPRQSLGGCGFWDKDVNWMTSFVMGKFNATTWQAVQDARNMNVTGPGGVAYKPRIEILDVGNAFQGHLLCEGATSGGPNPDVLTSYWTLAGSIDNSEWITQLRILPNFIGGLSSYALQEGFHPNYWGHLALRACLRLAYNNGNPKSGKCAPLTGSAGLGLNTIHSPAEPKMGLS
jgi:hypothetical protein